jgi:hypothetical protein
MSGCSARYRDDSNYPAICNRGRRLTLSSDGIRTFRADVSSCCDSIYGQTSEILNFSYCAFVIPA